MNSERPKYLYVERMNTIEKVHLEYSSEMILKINGRIQNRNGIYYRNY